MKVTSIVYKDAFKKGLFPSARRPLNIEYLETAQSIRVTADGLEGLATLSGPSFTLPSSASYPYTQYFRGTHENLLVYSGAIYTVDESSDTVTDSSPRIYTDVSTEYTFSGIENGYHFADMGSTWLLLNPDVTVFKMNMEMYPETDVLGHGGLNYTLVCPDLTFNTGCHHRGRVILGGPQQGIYTLSTWINIWNQYLDGDQIVDFELTSALPNQLADEEGKRYVWWSSIGAEDIWWLFYPQLAIEGFLPFTDEHRVSGEASFGAGKEPFMDILKRQEFGFMPMDSQGEVLVVKPLGDDVIVYSEDSVTRMFPIDKPFPSFGKETLLDIGLGFGTNKRGRVGGDDKEHVFMLANNELYRLRKGQGLERLDYAWTLPSEVSDSYPITILLDKYERDFYISTNVSTHVLSPYGLSTSEGVEGFTMLYRGRVGILHAVVIGGIAYASYPFTTGPTDFGDRSLKTLTQLEFGFKYSVSSHVNFHLTLLYRDDSGLGWNTYQPLIVVYPKAPIRLVLTAREFKIGLGLNDPLKGENVSDGLEINWLRVSYQKHDRRFTRGIDVG